MKDKASNTVHIFSVLLLIVIFNVRSFGQSKELNPSDFVEALVLVDSQFVAVKKNSETIASLKSSNKTYFSAVVRYDFLTGFICLIQCSTLTENHWKYKSLVWDYRTGNKWVVKEGKTFHGEGYIAPLVFRYRPSENTAVIQNYGWEWSWITYMSNDGEEKTRNLSHDYQRLLALLPDNRIIISGTYYGSEEPPEYFLYSWDSKELTKLNPNDLTDYKDEILRYSGHNVSFVNSQPFYQDKKFFDNIYWNHQGRAFIYTKYNPVTPLKRRLYLYQYSKKAQVQISQNYIAYAAIWKNSETNR